MDTEIYKIRLTVVWRVFFTLALYSQMAQAQEGVLTLDQAVSGAVEDDNWLVANEQHELALREEAVYAGQLPDPRMTVGLANLPVNTLDFNQEPMTQFRVGVSQSFPGGNRLALEAQQKSLQGDVNPYLRADRRAWVKMIVTNLWLDSFLAQQSLALINRDRGFFEQLVAVTDARYRNAAGPARQQDLIRAELELIRLDDRLASLRLQLDNSKEQLAQWLPVQWLERDLDAALPRLPDPGIRVASLREAAEAFRDHPRVRALDKEIEARNTGVELAQESYKPGFSVGGSYGYRDDGPMGIVRDDFISLEVSIDLPLFTEKRQRPRVEAASYRASASRTERTLLLKEMFADYRRAAARLEVLDERKALYEDRLLGSTAALTASVMAAYTADEGDFEEVMRANIEALNTTIDALAIDVETQKVRARLEYLLSMTTSQ